MSYGDDEEYDYDQGLEDILEKKESTGYADLMEEESSAMIEEVSSKQNHEQELARSMLGFGTYKDYECWTDAQIQLFRKGAVDKLVDMYDFSEGNAIALLSNFQWDAKLTETKLQEDVTVYEIITGDAPPGNKLVEEMTFTCPCCFDEVSVNEAFGLQCNHFTCKNCFREYVMSALDEGVTGVLKKCPMQGCKEILTEKCFSKLVSSAMYTKYQQYMNETVVRQSPVMCWCPGKGCAYAIRTQKKIEPEIPKAIKCLCGGNFCLGCKTESHPLLKCSQARDWLDVNQKDLEELWKKLGTKKCPKCGVLIEKNQGCNYMMCMSCKYEFCWICLAHFPRHVHSGGGGCNLWDPADKEKKPDNQPKEYGNDKVKDVVKYQFYFDRYLQHQKSLGFAVAKRAKLLGEFDTMNSKVSNPLPNSKFLREALDLIVDARRAISFSFAMARFMEKEEGMQYFEFQQGECHKYLEVLDFKTDVKLETFIGEDPAGGISFERKIFDFRDEVSHVSGVLSNYFNNMITYFWKMGQQWYELI